MNVLRMLLGCVLLPLCYVVSRVLVDIITDLHPDSLAAVPVTAWAMIAGFLLWQLTYFLMPRPIRTYVLAHELTHALWGLLMGARVSRLKVRRDSGSVTLSKTNVLITLAPYFFPFYTFLVIAVYAALHPFMAVERYSALWLGLVGYTWAFHFNFTLDTLMQRQTDIETYGRIFSYTVIYLVNILGVAVWVVMVSEATFEDLTDRLIAGTAEVYSACALYVWSAAQWLRRLAADWRR